MVWRVVGIVFHVKRNVMNTSKRVMIILGIVIILAFVVMMIVESVSKKTLEFEPLDAQMEILDKTYANWFGQKVDVQGQDIGQQVICDWMNYSALAAAGEDGWRDASDKFNANAMELVTRNNIQIDYWASQEAFEELYALYDGQDGKRAEILKKCGELEPELEKHIDTGVQKFHELAVREGFVNDSGKLIAEKKRIVQLLHRHLWVSVASRQFPRERLEPPEERLTFFRWQIEQSSLSDEVKLEKLMHSEATEHLPYDYAFAKAVILVRGHKYWDACQVIQEALSTAEESDKLRIERYHLAIKEIKSADSKACQ